MCLVDAGASQLQQLGAQRVIGREIKFALAVVADIPGCGGTGLQAIGADHRIVSHALDDDVVHDRVEFVEVVAGGVGGRQPFAQFKVEDAIAQPKRFAELMRVGHQFGFVICLPRAEERTAEPRAWDGRAGANWTYAKPDVVSWLPPLSVNHVNRVLSRLEKAANAASAANRNSLCIQRTNLVG